MGAREIGRYLTCKSDDVQRYAIHSSENIRRHAIGWAVVDLRLPKFTHLVALNRSGVRANEKRQEKDQTWSALSLKTGINERICAGPNAGLYGRSRLS